MLIIGVKRGKWRTGGTEGSSDDHEFRARRPQVLSRDKLMCRYCGTKLKRMEVHHEDDDHTNNDTKNLLTVCTLCHSVNHVGLLSKAGRIIYFPALLQEDISHLMRAILAVIARGGKDAEDARALASHLLNAYCKPIDEVFQSTNPTDFGNAMLSLSDEDYKSRATALKDVRVMFGVEAIAAMTTDVTESLYKNSGSDMLAEWQRITNGIDSNAEDSFQ